MSELDHRDTHPSPSAASLLRRYESLVDDVDAFLEASVRPLPRLVWFNSLRPNAAQIAAEVGERIRQRCPDAFPVPWYPAAWRVPAGEQPGRWLEFALGLIHTQEEISMWPSLVLAPLPGERVLDLCASPGNKTAHMAVAMQDRGCLVANEPKVARHTALSEMVLRLGLTSVLTAAADGRHFPGADASFDRVLVDAPCSCEGTSRKSRGKVRHNPIDSRFRMERLQKCLLRRAIELVKPGGIVVYSTCTYAPEENEGVLHSVPPEVAAIEPIEVPAGLIVSPGVAHWLDHEYRADVQNAARIWPHQNDTGGFFVARLRRL